MFSSSTNTATAANLLPGQRTAPRAAGGTPLSRLALIALCCGLFLALGPAAFASTSSEQAQQLDTALWEQATGLSYEIYRVRPGDTVENIAARFGVDPEQIRHLNRLSPSAQPQPARSLAVPLPLRPSSARRQRKPTPVSRTLQPCYAVVTLPSPITSEPTQSSAVQVFYEPQRSARLIVTAEQGDYWGIVMADGSTGWISKSSLQLTDQTLSTDTLDTMLRGGRPDIVQEAFRYLGTPYRYGGHLPYDMDCSLLVQTVFAARGLQLPRTAHAQYDFGKPVNHANLLPGDRLYFISKSGRINHTGIYIGNRRFIHASSRRGCVAVDKLSDPVYWPRFAGARRS